MYVGQFACQQEYTKFTEWMSRKLGLHTPVKNCGVKPDEEKNAGINFHFLCSATSSLNVLMVGGKKSSE